MYDIILFDLDGTLSDSGPGIMHSVRYALAKFGITGESEEALRRFVGPPMIPAYMRFYGFTREQAAQALAYYREVFPLLPVRPWMRAVPKRKTSSNWR